MKYMKLGRTELEVSRIAMGCFRIHALTVSETARLINAAIEAGVNFFDHADIYGGGKSEALFADAAGMKPSVREKMIIQTKCGIHLEPINYFDFSKEHIVSALEGSLKRLKTDYVDILLLHRPDALMEPEEIAEAFTALHDSGKVNYFGVSNQNPMQIELLKKYVQQDLIVNQLQLSVMSSWLVDAGLFVNTQSPQGVVRDGGVLDYCRLNDMTIQAWSPFQYGYFDGPFLDNGKFPELNRKIDELAAKYEVPNTAVAAAWILRHPAKMQVIPGTTNARRLKDICRATEIELSRREWYEIYLAAGNQLP